MMSYRISKEPDYPFKVFSTVTQLSPYKVELSLRV